MSFDAIAPFYDGAETILAGALLQAGAAHEAAGTWPGTRPGGGPARGVATRRAGGAGRLTIQVRLQARATMRLTCPS